MLHVERTYKNASGEVLRVDNLFLIQTTAHLGGNETASFYRDVQTVRHYGPASRTVSSITISGTCTSAEEVSGNFTWAAWTSPAARLDMSDLPIVGEDV